MTTEPTLAHEELEEFDEEEEDDVYELEGGEDDIYQPEEDEEDEADGDEDADEQHAESGNMTALLLGKQNGTTVPDEDDEDEDEDEDDDYQDEDTMETSPVVGIKRGVDELEEGGEETDTKKKVKV